MQKLIALLIATAGLINQAVVAANYSTDATMSLQKDEGILSVVVRVSRLPEQDGKLAEQLIVEPRIRTAPGVPATLYTGLQPNDPDYATRENVTVEVSWPYPNESGLTFCAVTIKRGNEIVSKSKLQLKIEGPGRVPLIIAAQDVDPKSVRVVEENSTVCLLLEFAGKAKQAAKKTAVENYGNKVQIRDAQGRLTDGGLSFGAYKEIGMALHFNTKGEATHVASILRGDAAN